MTHILSNNAMLTSLNASLWRARKLDKKLTREFNTSKNAAEDAGTYSKALVAKDALLAVKTVVQEARKFHYENTLPWDNVGWRILPSANYKPWTDAMRKFSQQFDAAVRQFVTDYPSYVTDAKTTLNGMFDQSDYPDQGSIKSHFSFDTDSQPIPDGSHFVLDLGQKEIDKQAKKLDKRVQVATKAAMGDLWTRLHDGVSHMAERLGAYKIDPKTGKVTGKFHDTLVGNLTDLCDLLPALNITNDPKLEAMRKKVEANLTKIAPQDLRDDPNARDKLAAAAENIADQMGAFMNA